MTLDHTCVECDEDFFGPPVVDTEQIAWTGDSLSWCSTGCHERSAERWWTNRPTRGGGCIA